MMVASYTRNQARAGVRMEKLQTQLATQKKIVRLSDDPANVVKALNARSRLYDVEQYRKNLDDSKAWLNQSETALNELNEVIKRASELAVQASNDVLTDDDRTAIASEIKELRDHVATLANSTLGDKFLFGGYNVSYPPFVFNPDEATFSLNGDNYVDVDSTGVVMYNINGTDYDMSDNSIDWEDPYGLERQSLHYEISITGDREEFSVDDFFSVSIPGAKFLGYGYYEDELPSGNPDIPLDSGSDKSMNIYTTLNEFYVVTNSMSTFNIEEADEIEILHQNVKPFIKRLQDIQNSTLSQISEVGGRIARIELMEERYSKDEINYTQMLSDVEDLDQAEAIMDFSMAEAVYRASLSVGGRILPPTLVDFMR
ncbi:MAG: flagellar hook-associated protein FlgL [Oscillospiraceae bacterium]|jgi:flagellar hook-associated protein 3 FlgL|nr:flagellar hook-associated protein FlgL [Oscillospiraceae bacterium]